MKKEFRDINYIIENGEAVIESCKDISGEIEIPAFIRIQEESFPVKRMAPYAFSGKGVNTLYLPDTLDQIGRYAFYRCFQLKKLVFSDRLCDIGAGAFTGCRLKELEIDFYQGKQSALKFIMDEVCNLMKVTLHYHGRDGETETARVIFPEHYEEAVENTPARLLETRHHGSGNDYRQCFYNRELQYQDYDALLSRAVAEESEEVVAELALLRLRFPYQLSDKASDEYKRYLKENAGTAGKLCARCEDMEGLKFLSGQGYFTEETIEQAIETAASEKKTAVLSLLMDEKYRYFPKKKKVFDL